MVFAFKDFMRLLIPFDASFTIAREENIMGQKTFKNDPHLTLAEFYPSSGASDSTSRHFFLQAEPIADGPASPSSRKCPSQSACEFSDFCNYMYYIEDRCLCATSWKRLPGLVLPTSV
jgi:hypothetical protein